tara:strand:- start:189 stop:497 length:309 start_codon:yes stop_codon:yes gene_type:complete
MAGIVSPKVAVSPLRIALSLKLFVKMLQKPVSQGVPRILIVSNPRRCARKENAWISLVPVTSGVPLARYAQPGVAKRLWDPSARLAILKATLTHNAVPVGFA